MKKTTPKSKQNLRIIVVSIFALPALVVLVVIGSVLLSPVFDSFDKARFEKLDTQSKELYEELVSQSGGAETWTYKTFCDQELSGPWPTGEFICRINMSMRIAVSSLNQVNILEEKYYPTVNSSAMLKSITELDKQRPSDFGVRFVTATAERYYNTRDGSIKCKYFADLSDLKSIEYGVELSSANAFLTISIECSDRARGNWFL